MPREDHYVIIGNGPAGNSAADFLRRHDEEARITIISNESLSFYLRNKLPDFIAGKADEKDLIVRPYSVYKEKNIRMRLGQQVDRIDPTEKTLYLKHLEKVSYTKLIIATGGTPNTLPSMATFSEHLKFMTTHTDAVHLIPGIRNSNSFVVMGGDVISFKFIRMLKNMGKDVTLVLYGDAFWPFSLTEEMIGTIKTNMENEGLHVIYQDRVSSVEKKDRGYVVGTEKGTTLPCDMVFSFLGLVPNIRFIVGSGIDTDRGILVDDNLRTNFPDIYACGDCAQIYNPELKSYWVSIGWQNAQVQGMAAARNLLGDNKVIKPLPQKVLEVEGLRVNTSWWKSF